jgi:hypothetical protein
MQETGFSRVWLWQNLIKNTSSNKDMPVRELETVGEQTSCTEKTKHEFGTPFFCLLCTVLILTFWFCWQFWILTDYFNIWSILLLMVCIAGYTWSEMW